MMMSFKAMERFTLTVVSMKRFFCVPCPIRLILVMSAIYLEKENLIVHFHQIGFTVIGLILSIVFVVGVLVWILKIKTDQKKTILIECGIQNAALGVYLGSEFFGGGLTIIPPTLYGLMMFPIAVLFIIISRFHESI